ncbi:hypothetical protein HDU77_011321 [Chytriomyces hyalinus]|nr:hypothetical protein HDU77_011321 [Chytriomyces hyalinus]
MNRQSPILSLDPRLNKLAVLDTRMQECTPSPSPTESVQFRYPSASNNNPTTITTTTKQQQQQQLETQKKLHKTCKQSINSPVVVAESALLQIKPINKMSIAFLVEQDTNDGDSKMLYRSRLHYVRPKSVRDSWQRSKGGPANPLRAKRAAAAGSKGGPVDSLGGRKTGGGSRAKEMSRTSTKEVLSVGQT